MKYVDIDFPYDEAENYFQSGNKDKMNHFFYKGDVFDKLTKQTTYYLVGDKGSGKTAYSAYFCNNQIEGNIKSKFYQICVDDYNKIIQMKADGKLDYTHYVTLWKAIILIKICSSLDQNEISIWGKKGYKKITELLTRYKFTEFTLDSFSPVSFMDSYEFGQDVGVDFKKESVNPNVNQSQRKANQVTIQKNIFL